MIRLENVLITSSKRLEDVLKMSWKRLEDVLKTFWRRLEDVLKMSWWYFEDVLSIRFEEVLQTSWKRLEDVFWRRMSKANTLVLMKTSWRRFDDVFWRRRRKTSSSRRMFAAYNLQFLAKFLTKDPESSGFFTACFVKVYVRFIVSRRKTSSFGMCSSVTFYFIWKTQYRINDLGLVSVCHNTATLILTSSLM